MLRERNGRSIKHGIVAGLVTAIVLGGATASYAYWTTSASVSSTPKAASLVVTATAVSLAATYGNDTLTSTSYLQVRNDTVTTSTTVPALTVSLGSQNGGALAANTAIQAWSVSAPSACATSTPVPSSGVFTGNWGSGATVSGMTLAKNTTATVCIRSTIADRNSVASSSGTLSFTPVATATINVALFTASGSGTGTQSTQYIYSPTTLDRQNWYFIKPQNQSNCLDVSNGDLPATSGTTFISYPCKSTTDTSNYIWNQLWTFLPTGDGYAELKPRSGPSVRVDSSGVATGSLTVKTDTSGASQLWDVQSVGGGLYQFINKATGLCMNVSTGAADANQAACSSAATQRFSIVSQGHIGLDNLSCAIGGTGTARTLTYSFWQNDTGAYALQVNTAGTWTTVGTTGTTASSVSATIGGYAATAGGTTYDTRIVDRFGVTIDTGTFVARSTNPWTCT